MHRQLESHDTQKQPFVGVKHGHGDKGRRTVRRWHVAFKVGEAQHVRDGVVQQRQHCTCQSRIFPWTRNQVGAKVRLLGDTEHHIAPGIDQEHVVPLECFVVIPQMGRGDGVLARVVRTRHTRHPGTGRGTAVAWIILLQHGLSVGTHPGESLAEAGQGLGGRVVVGQHAQLKLCSVEIAHQRTVA